ncbi:unnamed protein product [Angiostrongylus costaricensis]|uniref:Uncharacterized protein n=1 Tax=Angiostrongylus costaricensis TaxID=334426 RepID=A0A0R3PI86_ANGCS|nr:unnamed protein product [Angiostrongylus costaricensis]
MTSGGETTGERPENLGLRRMSLEANPTSTRSTRHGNCFLLCTYSARTLSTDADPYALLVASCPNSQDNSKRRQKKVLKEKNSNYGQRCRGWKGKVDLARHEGEDATSRRTTSMDHRLGSPALRKTKTSKR